MSIHGITTALAGVPVRVEIDGEVVAESENAIALQERGLPTRYYFPRADVRAELLPSEKQSHCPFKGDASYHSIGEHEDVAWFYPEPKERVEVIRDHVAFYNDRVDLVVDGRRR